MKSLKVTLLPKVVEEFRIICQNHQLSIHYCCSTNATMYLNRGDHTGITTAGMEKS